MGRYFVLLSHVTGGKSRTLMAAIVSVGEFHLYAITPLVFYTYICRIAVVPEFLPRESHMLPKTAEYALRAIVSLARTPDVAQSADQLAEATQAPRRYLHKVLQDLVKADLVRSRSGPHGGYSLARIPENVTILDVVNAVGSIERIRSCPLGLQSHTNLCPLHRELDKAYATVQDAFARVTVASVANRPNGIPPLCEVHTIC